MHKLKRLGQMSLCVIGVLPKLSGLDRMGILKGLLGQGEKSVEIDDSASPSAFAAAEAAMDRAIKEREAAAKVEPVPDETTSAEPKVERGEDRRKGDGVRPGGLPDRRSGRDRRAPKAFGRRGQT